MMLDAGYDAIKNYKVIRDAGRKPMICTRKNHVARVCTYLVLSLHERHLA